MRLLLAGISLLVSLAAVEGLLAIFHVETMRQIHFSVRATSCRSDPELIWTFVPGISGSWGNGEFTEVMRINSLGMRETEIEPRQPGEERVLAIGDSFTYGHGVKQHESYPRVLEGLLRARGYPVRVLNGGQSGYGMDQSYKMFVTRRIDLAPDLVLVGIHCTDVVDDVDESLYDIRGGELVPLDARHNWIYLQNELFWGAPKLVRNLKSYRLLLGVLDRRDPYRQLPRLGEMGLRAWQRKKIVLEVARMRELGAARGFRVLVILMPCNQDLEASPPDLYLELADRIAELGVPVLRGIDELRARSPDVARLFFRTDMHLDPDGDRVLAGSIADFIVREHALPGASGGG